MALWDFEPTTHAPAAGRLVYQTVRDARNVATARAYQEALDDFALEQDNDISATLVDRAERRATGRLRSVADRYPTPFAAAALSTADRWVRNAHIGLADAIGGDREQERARAYAAYLAGEYQLRHLPAVLSPFEGETIQPAEFE